MKNTMILIAATLLLSACSGIKLTTGGEKVRILDPGEVSSCRKLGKTSNAVTARVVVERPEEAIAKELRILARNSAAGMGGDTIVPLTVIENGQQTFEVFKCVNPNG
ncbi:MAG TPA: DUF4156 domain-containing protein [Gammaproteobacteria bacterium]|nr:DUF4156 domain-containing protein [Gammaproteobacteria bacterium]